MGERLKACSCQVQEPLVGAPRGARPSHEHEHGESLDLV